MIPLTDKSYLLTEIPFWFQHFAPTFTQIFIEMKTENNICPAEKSWLFSNRLRNLLQPPKKMLQPYIKEGQDIVDLGCGPGHFSIPIAKMVGLHGSITCVDVQQAMLDKVKRKVQGSSLGEIFKFQLCEPDKLHLNSTYDFALAFYMVHEVPNKKMFLTEVYDHLKCGGELLIVEPKGHVNVNDFETMIDLASSVGFTKVEEPNYTFSLSTLLMK